MQDILPAKNSPHVFVDQTLTLLDYWPEVAKMAPDSPGAWWLVTRALAQALEAAGEVVATAACSAWWFTSAARPEDALEALGLTDFHQWWEYPPEYAKPPLGDLRGLRVCAAGDRPQAGVLALSLALSTVLVLTLKSLAVSDRKSVV